METIREKNRKEEKLEQTRTDLQSKTRNKLDSRQGGQKPENPGKPRRPSMAGPDQDMLFLYCYSYPHLCISRSPQVKRAHHRTVIIDIVAKMNQTTVVL